MRRFQIPNAALVAGLAVLLSGCSGETPTAPSSNGGNGGGNGSCTALVSMSATTQSPIVGSTAIVRATVTRSGVPVPDGGSVQYTTDLGFFEENGLNTISKTTVGGVADVTVFSSNSGTAHVKAVFDCANAQINLQFGGVPDTGPFISSLSPTTGSCAGGDVVTILGGRFGNGTNLDVFFGGVRGSIKGAVTDTQITVTTPAHPLKNPAVPETVDVVVVVNKLTSPPFQFTFACIPSELKLFLSSINPTAGSPAGGDTVQIFGGHFGTNIATTQVTFCGAPAQIVAQQDQQITVTTPKHALANPAISETCDVSVRRDIGLVSENSATLPQAFTYRGNGSGGICNTDPTFFIASLTPNSGPPDGGTTVTLTGSGFGSTVSLMRVDFGGTPATIVTISNTTIVVSTPRHTLASPDVPETVDVTVTDLGSPVQRCARVVNGFVYTAAAPTIFSLSPTTGSCAGGDVVTILGARFGNGTNLDVFFGGVRGSIKGAVTDTQITVTTPAHPLKNPAVPETVNVVVVVNGLRSPPFQFTYVCIPPELKLFLSSINPTAGSPAGGDTVQVFGGHFGTNIATTLVTFCGASATIVAQQDQQITVTTPRHALANPAISETCDVSVRRDIGLVSENSATLPQAFTYRGNGSGATCNTDPTFFIASLTPNSGPPDGGTIVTLTGSGFGSTVSLMRVDFGGTPATIVTISNTTVVVSTPRHTLASPDVPETVDVTVTDLGSPVQRCARVVNGFVYTAKALDPVIYSVSPRTGPNDASTRVSIFGTGFQFPMQVFLTGGNCGAQRVEAAVSDISLTTIVFKTPVAVGGNVCLANQLVTIVIVNPSTGKTADCKDCFKYYSCPTITSIAPGFGPYTGGTQVVITGHNFEEPATVGGGGTAWSTISVSSQEIIAVTPPALVTGCSDISSPVLVNGTSLSCQDAIGPIFTYYVKSLSPFITSISPSSVPEAGAPGVVITGGNFIDNNMRVVVNGINVFPTSRTATQITFTAPPFVGTFNQGVCTVGTTTGSRNLATSVPLDVLNVTTTCTSAVDQLTYIPADTTCIIKPVAPVPLVITTTTLPDATNGTPYTFTLSATGGTTPYTWTLLGTLPTGLTLNASTGVISGTPTVASTFNFSVTVTDSLGATATANLSIKVN
jgi:hypothetical protein